MGHGTRTADAVNDAAFRISGPVVAQVRGPSSATRRRVTPATRLEDAFDEMVSLARQLGFQDDEPKDPPPTR